MWEFLVVLSLFVILVCFRRGISLFIRHTWHLLCGDHLYKIEVNEDATPFTTVTYVHGGNRRYGVSIIFEGYPPRWMQVEE